MGASYFAAQYLQAPVAPGGNMINEAWFPRYDPDNAPTFDKIIQSWDTANKVSEFNDFSVCTTLGLKGKHSYLINVFRKKLEYPELKRAVSEQAKLHQAKVILIEDRVSGVQLIQELRAAGVSGITAISPKGDKVMRMRDQTAAIEAGFVHLPKRAHWLADLLHELAAFPVLSGKR